MTPVLRRTSPTPFMCTTSSTKDMIEFNKEMKLHPLHHNDSITDTSLQSPILDLKQIFKKEKTDYFTDAGLKSPTQSGSKNFKEDIINSPEAP